jgi:uncharacterized membrane protein (DUF441 family)
MSDYLVSLIRTWVPIAVGVVLTWLARRWGIVLPEDLSAQATMVVTGLAVAAYYTAIRALEMRWPKAGRLLGAARPPAYKPPA